VPFIQRPLFYVLRNRFYISEVVYKGETCPGPQPPLLDRALTPHRAAVASRHHADQARGTLARASVRCSWQPYGADPYHQSRCAVSLLSSLICGARQAAGRSRHPLPVTDIETSATKTIEEKRRNITSDKKARLIELTFSRTSPVLKCIRANWRIG
jgi:hypothetical protein